MTYLLGLVIYLVVGLFVSRWLYRRERWLDVDSVPALILLWPFAVTCRAWLRFFRWFYKRPERRP